MSENKKTNILVFDVEATSLHGKGFAFGAIVVDVSTRKEVASLALKSIEGEKNASEWVKTNVIPHLKDMKTVPTDKELRVAFWNFYLDHRDTSYIWADVAYPVETNFLEEVYNDNPGGREFEMPYPLFDVANHVDVGIDRAEYCKMYCGITDLAKHNPYDDAKASAYSLLNEKFPNWKK